VSCPLSLNPELSDYGVRSGVGTLLLEAGQDGRDKDAGIGDTRLAALLGAAYKRAFPPDTMVNLRNAARHWARGDRSSSWSMS